MPYTLFSTAHTKLNAHPLMPYTLFSTAHTQLNAHPLMLYTLFSTAQLNEYQYKYCNIWWFFFIVIET